MGKDPTVTVIIPVYNGEAFLPDAIESIQKQTFEDWECIVVDDGSMDLSENVARAFGERDPRIWTIRLDRNGGAAQAFNHALCRARGRYVAFLAADDFWREDFLEQCVDELERTRVIAVYTDFIEWQPGKGLAGIKDVHLPDFSSKRLLVEDYVNFSALVMRNRGHASFVDSFWEPISDWDAIIRMSKLGSFAHVRKLLGVRRVHSGQITVQRANKMLLRSMMLPFWHAPVGLAMWSAARRLYFHVRNRLRQAFI